MSKDEEPEMQDGPVLADRLNQVVLEVAARDGLNYTNKMIAERARAAGFTISEAVVNHVRKGRVPNPGYRTIAALAAALDVDIRRLFFSEISNQEASTEPSLAVGFRGLEVDKLNNLGKETFNRLASAILRDMASNDVYCADEPHSIEDEL